MDIRQPRTAGWLSSLANVAILVALAAIFFGSPGWFSELTEEDGAVEWITFLCYAIAGIFFLVVARLRWQQDGVRTWFYILLAAGCLAIAGEEISWGQRLLGFRTPGIVAKHNYQGELTLHNIGDFGKNWLRRFYMASMFLYIVVLPALIPYWQRLRRTTETLRIVVPPRILAVPFLCSLVLPLWMFVLERIGSPLPPNHENSVEVMEMFSGFLFLEFCLIEWRRARAVSSATVLSRKWLLRITAVALGLGAGVVLAEIALRVFHVVPLADVATVNESEFARVPGIYRPHQDYVDREIPELPYRVRINGLGYRGPELTIAKPEGETRVLMIGDSFVYGDFVEDDETLPAQLEAALDGPCPLRVVNAGLRGGTIVGTSQMLQRGLTLDPDLALVVFTENDVRDLASPIWYSLERNRDLKSRPPLSFLYPVLRHTALWNLAMQWRATRRAASARAPKAVDAPPVEKESAGITSKEQRLRKGYEERLALLAERLRQWRVPLVFAIYPSHRSIDGGQSEQIDWLLGVADSLEIETINLYPGLAAYPASETYLIPIDGHPSSRGYSIAAESLAERLATMEPLHACLGGRESGP